MFLLCWVLLIAVNVFKYAFRYNHNTNLSIYILIHIFCFDNFSIVNDFCQL